MSCALRRPLRPPGGGGPCIYLWATAESLGPRVGRVKSFSVGEEKPRHSLGFPQPSNSRSPHVRRETLRMAPTASGDSAVRARGVGAVFLNFTSGCPSLACLALKKKAIFVVNDFF